jgi:diacylglycerol kinase (ATP)
MTEKKPCNGLHKEAWRIIAAFGYSVEGLKWALKQPAFRIELLACAVMAPLALMLSSNGLERAVLVGSLILVLVVECLNSGIEAAIDRISSDIHPLSKAAKDVGSAAVLLCIINACVIWFFIILT